MKRLVLRIPKNMKTNKVQLALNQDLSKMLGLLRKDVFESLRIEIVESSWILVWNVLNVEARHCANGEVLRLQSLEVHLFDPDTKGRGKRDRDTKEMIMKIKDCLMTMTECGYLALFVLNVSQQIQMYIKLLYF